MDLVQNMESMDDRKLFVCSSVLRPPASNSQMFYASWNMQ